jgi:hypothetical protein
LAALVGLIGGLGGAAIGGAIANEGQEQRAMDQREAQLQDLAIETYSSYVRIAGTAYIRLAGDVSTSEAQKAGLIGVVEGGQAEVAFLTADPEVVTTADRLEQLLAGLADGQPVDDQAYRAVRDEFIQAAENSIGSP